MRIAVLGGTRFIGPAIVDRLRAGGHEVSVLHRGSTDPHRADVPDVHLDRADETALRAALRDQRAEVLIDTCAYSRRDAEIAVAALHSDLHAVVLSSMDVYRAFASLRAGRVTDPVPLTETSALRSTRYPYRGEHVPLAGIDVDTYEKLDVEECYLAAGAIILRLPMVFGERDPLRREEFILRRVRAGRTQIPFGAGTFLWSRGWVRDIGAAVALAVEADLTGEVLNVCEAQTWTVELWARAILEAAGSDADLVRVPDDQLPEDLRLTGSISQHLLADSSKARRLLGWSDSDPMEAVRASVTWHLTHSPPDPDPDFSADDAALRTAR
jgi:nucleoside-diphosphate-sugar epimerase